MSVPSPQGPGAGDMQRGRGWPQPQCPSQDRLARGVDSPDSMGQPGRLTHHKDDTRDVLIIEGTAGLLGLGAH